MQELWDEDEGAPVSKPAATLSPAGGAPKPKFSPLPLRAAQRVSETTPREASELVKRLSVRK